MKTIAIPRRAKTINHLLKKARRENLVVRSADGREFILAEIDDFNREIELTRQNKDLMKLLDDRAKETSRISLEEAKTKLALVGD